MKFSFFKKKSGNGIDQSVEKLKAAAEEKPNDPRSHTKLAERYLQHGRREEAVAAYLNGARVARLAGKTKIAVAVYSHILSFDPGRTEVYHLLCDLFLKDHYVGDAVEILVRLAAYQYDQGLKYEAGQVLNNIRDIDPENKFYKSKVERFYRERNLTEAEVVQAGPQDKWNLVSPDGQKAAADAPVPSKAGFDLEHALDGSSSINIDSASALSGVSSGSLDRVNPERVLGKLDSLVGGDQQENTPAFHYNLARVYQARGEFQNAEDHFSKALDGIENKLECYRNLFECSLAGNRLEAAGRYIKAARKLKFLTDADRLCLDFQQGLLYKAAGDKKSAVKIFQKIFKKDKSFKGVAGQLNELR